MPVTPALFDFFTDLAENNTRDWFARNKHRYETHVKQPLLDLVRDMAPYLTQISPYCQAVPKVGDSLFRIYRDIRFSKDKRSYKEHAGVQFRHAERKGAHAPGFYLHLEPGGCFAAAGIWGPDTPTLTLIRQTIADNPAQWMALKDHLAAHFDLETHSEHLKRMPRGFDKHHACADDLKRKHFIASCRLTQEQVTDKRFADSLARIYRQGAGLNAFITHAMGLRW